MQRTHESSPPMGFEAGPTMFEGPRREVLRLAAAALDIAELRGIPVEMCSALTAMGRAYRCLGACGAAEEMLRQGLRWARASAGADLQVEVLCELGEAACGVAQTFEDGNGSIDSAERAHGARERARDAAFEVATLARAVSDPHWEAKALLRASDVLNRCGDHEDAAGLQRRALLLMQPGASH